ncbi:MAG TPA: SRPBCC domain-containing protein [Solirubrobacterales bacterium]|nr:SRPBCC domain-containing protein [Solirubrobacterales bacterium]
MSNLPHTVKRSVVLAAAPEEVWEAVTDEELLSEWLAPEVELEPHEGGGLHCRFEDGEERHGEVELVEEAERLSFRWWRDGAGPSRVELLVDAVAGGTRLTVIESRLDPGAPALAAATWSAPLARLRLLPGKLVLA